MRADAAQNRARLLAVAEELFRRQGIAVEMDEIAAQAGVAVGTIYRHFSSKATLIEAVIAGPVEALIADMYIQLGAPDPSRAFFEVLDRLVDVARAKQHLVAAIVDAGHESPTNATPDALARRERFHTVLGKLLQRGQHAGAIARDVHAEDIVAIVNGAIPYLERNGGTAASHERFLYWLRRSLRADE